jgi:hypothetical protein
MRRSRTRLLAVSPGERRATIDGQREQRRDEKAALGEFVYVSEQMRKQASRRFQGGCRIVAASSESNRDE